MTEQAMRGRLARRRFVLSHCSPAGDQPWPACRPGKPRRRSGSGPFYFITAIPAKSSRPSISPMAATCRRHCRRRPTICATGGTTLNPPIDPQLLDLLWSLRANAGDHGPDPGLSAATARPRPTPCCGAPTTAPHATACTCGRMAVDLFVPDRPLRIGACRRGGLKAGGVGYYPRSGFVHVDTGDIRYW